jgi:trimeric autotransporter adhesin
MNGQEVKTLELTQRGQGSVQLSTSGLASGMYIYHLVVNGEKIDSKKLVLNR